MTDRKPTALQAEIERTNARWADAVEAKKLRDKINKHLQEQVRERGEHHRIPFRGVRPLRPFR